MLLLCLLCCLGTLALPDILRSVPWYSVYGNHDTWTRLMVPLLGKDEDYSPKPSGVKDFCGGFCPEQLDAPSMKPEPSSASYKKLTLAGCFCTVGRGLGLH